MKSCPPRETETARPPRLASRRVVDAGPSTPIRPQRLARTNDDRTSRRQRAILSYSTSLLHKTFFFASRVAPLALASRSRVSLPPTRPLIRRPHAPVAEGLLGRRHHLPRVHHLHQRQVPERQRDAHDARDDGGELPFRFQRLPRERIRVSLSLQSNFVKYLSVPRDARVAVFVRRRRPSRRAGRTDI